MHRRGLPVVLAATLASCGGVSTIRDSGGSGGSAGDGPVSGAGGFAARGSGGVGGTGVGGTGGTATGGSGGSIVVPDGGQADAGAICTIMKAESLPPQLDVVWAIDTSANMTTELPLVRAALESFGQEVVASGVDAHVVLLADPSPLALAQGVCMPTPLGSGACTPAGADSNLPQFFHHATATVGSLGALATVYDSFADYRPHLRRWAPKALVVVSDADSSDPRFPTANDFVEQLRSLDSGVFGEFSVSGIYAFTQCATATAPGLRYRELIERTGGIHVDLCTFNGDISELTTDVLAQRVVTCSWQLPPPPAGTSVDWRKGGLHLAFADGSERWVTHVTSEAQCDPVEGGWYYDNNVAATFIVVCPATCTLMENAISIDIALDCEPPVDG